MTVRLGTVGLVRKSIRCLRLRTADMQLSAGATAYLTPTNITNVIPSRWHHYLNRKKHQKSKKFSDNVISPDYVIDSTRKTNDCCLDNGKYFYFAK